MIVLANGDSLRGSASVNAVIDYSFHGIDGTTIALLAEGQLTGGDAELYPATAIVVVKSMVLVNTHSAAVTINLTVLKSESAARRLVPKDLSLGIGFSLHFDGSRICVINASGEVLRTVDTSLFISDEAYAASWNGVTDKGASKNTIYDEMETRTKAAAVITDHRLIRGDGGARGVQESAVLLSDDGEMTNPNQPAFEAKLTANELNVTGNGDNWNSYDGANNWTEMLNQGNHFDGDGTFTAAVDGLYLFSFVIAMEGIAAAHTNLYLMLRTSNNNYYAARLNPQKIAAALTLSAALLTWMDANDTAYTRLTIQNGTKVVDVMANTTNFAGALVC